MIFAPKARHENQQGEIKTMTGSRTFEPHQITTNQCFLHIGEIETMTCPSLCSSSNRLYVLD
jgi:hypothetical protein